MVTNPFLCNGEAGFQVNGWVDKQMASPSWGRGERAWRRILFCVMGGAGFQVNGWIDKQTASPPWGRRERGLRHNKKSEVKRLRIFNHL